MAVSDSTPLGRGLIVALLLTLALAAQGWSQDVRIRDLTLQDQTVPVRLMGYGLVVGLDGTGDRAMGGRSGGQTVQSVVNLLRHFDVEVPSHVLTTRNVAAVLVTAEISPFLRPGGRFEVTVSSLGDARSIRGGVLWMTPLVAEPGGPAMASAQGSLVISQGNTGRNGHVVETTARLPGGGVLELDPPRPAFASVSRLLLREPDLGTATRIAAAIEQEFGAGSAFVEDPGSVALQLNQQAAERAQALARINDLRIQPDRPNRVVINARDGTVVAGGDLRLGEASVSHGPFTLSIGAEQGGGPGDLRVETGTTVQQVAAALHAMQSTAREIAMIFESLHRVGALSAEVVIQ
jgi:flagellar P-ring protein FlgI